MLLIYSLSFFYILFDVHTVFVNYRVIFFFLLQASKSQNPPANNVVGLGPELRRTSSFDRSWEETVAECVANELVLRSISSSKSDLLDFVEQQDEFSKNKLKDPKTLKTGRSSHEEKKVAKSREEKRSRPQKMMELHNINISRVCLVHFSPLILIVLM